MPYRFDAAYPEYAYKAGSIFLGRDDKGHEIGIRTDRHVITIGGARSGKGAALLIPNALRWPENILVIDVKGENAAAVWQARETMGQHVGVLDPYRAADVPDRLRISINPLDAIDPASFTASEEIRFFADGMIVRSNPKNAEWDNGARDILAGVIAYVLCESPPEKRTLLTVREILLQPNTGDDDTNGNPTGLYATAQLMTRCEGCGGLAKAAGLTIMTALETDSGRPSKFLEGARTASAWLDSDAMKAALSDSTFRLSELKTGQASLFLVLPPKYLVAAAAFFRLFVQSALAAMQSSATVERRCLFMLDEFHTLGKMDEINKAAGLMSGYGLHLWPFLQNLGQLHELYGDHAAETFFGNADMHIFFGNGDAFTLEYVSRNIGTLTPDDVGTPFAAPDSRYLDHLAQGAARQFSPAPVDPKSQYSWITTIANGFGADRAASRRAAFDNEMRAHQERVANLRSQHEHTMRKVGSRRLEPREIAALVGKAPHEKVAPSMIVFGPKRRVFNLLLAPYFMEQNHLTSLSEQTLPPAQRYADGYAKWDASHPAWSSVEGIPDEMVNDYNNDQTVITEGMALDEMPRIQWPQFPQWEKEYRLGITASGFMVWYLNDWSNSPEGRAARGEQWHQDELEKQPVGQPETVILSKTGTRQVYYFDSQKRPVVVIYGPKNEVLTCYHPAARAGFYEVDIRSNGEKVKVQSRTLVQRNIEQLKQKLEKIGVADKIFRRKSILSDKIYLQAFNSYLSRMENQNWHYMVVDGRKTLPNGNSHPILITPDEYFSSL